MIRKFNKICINQNLKLKQVMIKISENGLGCVIVINNNNIVVGTISDGDIRRKLIKNQNFNIPIKQVMEKNFIFLKYKSWTKIEALNLLKKNKITLIPVVDDKFNLKNYITYDHLLKNNNKNKTIISKNSVVIIAGGKGIRLQPFTNVLPKPLIPINNRPIIEHIISKFNYYNLEKIHVSLNYKAEIIKSYLDESLKNNNINYYKENKPLGTIGSLRLIKSKLKKDFFVTNCDVIVDINYIDFFNFHKKNKFDLTIIASLKKTNLPYGVCEIDNKGQLINLTEKPKIKNFVNIGFYLIKPEMLKYIPNGFFDFNEFVNKLLKLNKKIGIYPIQEKNWIDIGQWPEYKKINQKLL